MRGIFLEDRVQGLDEEIRVRFRKDQRRAQLENVVMRTVGAGKDAAVAQSIDDVRCLKRRRLSRFAVEHKIDSQEKSGPSDVADQIVMLLQLFQTTHEVSSHAQGMLLQLLFFQNIQNRETRRASDRIAAKRAEKFHAIIEGISDLLRGDHCAKRKRIANGLAKNNDVWNDALRFESPEVITQPPKSHLDFVGDANAART